MTTDGYGEMRWQEGDVAKAREVLQRAENLMPGVLTILGNPGVGKSSFLGEIIGMAEGFTVLSAGVDYEDYAEPFSLLRRLGAQLPDGGGVLSPIVAAQALRETVDAESATHPVLIAVDNIHDADPESVEALYWLLQRARGERMALVASARDREIGRIPVWSRLVTGAKSIRLSGMDVERASYLIRGYAPRASDADVRRLVEGTDGNPLYLSSMLRQFPLEQLMSAPELPAPTELTIAVRADLAKVDSGAVDILNAAAVLGHAWWGVPLVAAVAGVDEGWASVDILVERGLLTRRDLSPGAPIRTSHALVRTAAYQTIPGDERRRLHLRCAEVLGEGMPVLAHRVAAVASFDDELADELDASGAESATAIDCRRAAQLYRWSADVTSNSSRREDRLLEALYQRVLAQDVEAVRDEILALEYLPGLLAPVTVRGALHVVEKDYAAAARVLEEGERTLDHAPSGRWRFRWAVLLVHARIALGRPTEHLVPLVEEADRSGAFDPALATHYGQAVGQLALRSGFPGVWTTSIAAVPTSPSSTPPELDASLQWRGVLYAYSADATRSVADLAEVTSRIVRGRSSQTVEGGCYPLLALARWQRGDWMRAAIDIDLAFVTAVGSPHPLALAIRPIITVTSGDADKTAAELAAAEDMLRAMPWLETIEIFAAALVIAAHASGDRREQKGVLERLRTAFGPILTAPEGHFPAFPLAHLIIAAGWAGDEALAREYLLQLAHLPYRPTWLTWGEPWLEALVSESAGDSVAATRQIDLAVAGLDGALPLYGAHVLADASRIYAAARRQADSTKVTERAVAMYRRLGAVPYIERVSTPIMSDTATEPPRDDLAALSEREQAVAILVAEGLSYAQVARELFVSTSTVSFHLSNIYAKTGVKSRHELSSLVRLDRELGRRAVARS